MIFQHAKLIVALPAFHSISLPHFLLGFINSCDVWLMIFDFEFSFLYVHVL